MYFLRSSGSAVTHAKSPSPLKRLLYEEKASLSISLSMWSLPSTRESNEATRRPKIPRRPGSAPLPMTTPNEKSSGSLEREIRVMKEPMEWPITMWGSSGYLSIIFLSISRASLTTASDPFFSAKKPYFPFAFSPCPLWS